jgi:hypothetical protein
LLFAGGYGYRFWTEPETICKEIKFKAPESVLEPVTVRDCKQDNKGSECPIKYPRFVISEKDYAKAVDKVKETRAYLIECNGIITMYNKDKSIEVER